eukprot:jgi/Botrbrau1/23487/Bobra.106_1s0038.1
MPRFFAVCFLVFRSFAEFFPPLFPIMEVSTFVFFPIFFVCYPHVGISSFSFLILLFSCGSRRSISGTANPSSSFTMTFAACLWVNPHSILCLFGVSLSLPPLLPSSLKPQGPPPPPRWVWVSPNFVIISLHLSIHKNNSSPLY